MTDDDEIIPAEAETWGRIETNDSGEAWFVWLGMAGIKARAPVRRLGPQFIDFAATETE